MGSKTKATATPGVKSGPKIIGTACDTSDRQSRRNGNIGVPSDGDGIYIDGFALGRPRPMGPEATSLLVRLVLCGTNARCARFRLCAIARRIPALLPAGDLHGQSGRGCGMDQTEERRTLSIY